VSGRLTLASGIDPTVVSARIDLPEIPLDIVRTGEDLFRDKEGNFSIDMHFQAQKKPAIFSFVAEASGGGIVKIDNLRLDEEPGPEGESKLAYVLKDLSIPLTRPAPLAPQPPRFPTPQPHLYRTQVPSPGFQRPPLPQR
jgi:hypothetical protein